MRNKYGKLFIEVEDNGDWVVKEEYRQPLLDYCKARQYKDIIMCIGNEEYYICNHQSLSNGSGIFMFGFTEYSGETILSQITITINVVLSNNTINVTYSEI